jgi:nucleotide-binding universal stress UspA family protein
VSANNPTIVRFRHLLVAADESAEGRAAIRAALDLSGRSRAQVTVLMVAEGNRDEAESHAQLENLRSLVRAAAGRERAPLANLAVAFGIPGIEIVRFAEQNDVDLIIGGRKNRSDLQRLLVGDTAASVARRSSVPCLFVLGGDPRLEHVLVALNGSERGLTVLSKALDFSRAAGARVHAVSVETVYPGEAGVTSPMTERSERLARVIDETRRSADFAGVEWEGGEPNHAGQPLVICRGGDTVESIVAQARRSGADVLVVGFHRGGPAEAVEGGSVARRLVHVAPCAVMTVPL